MTIRKYTFIATVFQESKTINRFLQSISKQSLLPDEVIITDGGSSDDTVNMLKAYSRKEKRFPIYIRIKHGNRSIGRNDAIRRSKFNIILCSDAGCELDTNWIKNITKPFEDPAIDVVAGYYKGISNNNFEQCIIPYALVMPDKIKSYAFLPATRSMAFRKHIWQEIGEFPEEYSHNEDYVFSNRLKENNKKIAFIKTAVVYWYPPQTLSKFIKMIFRFALGDAEASYYRPKVILIFLRYFLFIGLFIQTITSNNRNFLFVLFLSIVVYISWSIQKNFQYVKKPIAIIYLPLLQITSDIAVLTGSMYGFIKQLFKLGFKNKKISLVFVFYILICILQIIWGIPNNFHPFTYHMDEWHQLMAVKGVFKHGSPNIPGAANGALLQYFLSGIYLTPFILYKIINPFIITSPLTHLFDQEKLFIVLRSNSIVFGVATMLVLLKIGKLIYNLPLFQLIFLFTISPLWLMLSGYFKYDIALLFWITVSFYFLCKSAIEENHKDILFTGFFIGCALATKLSAIPLIPAYLIILLLLKKKNYKVIFYSFLIFFCTFFIFGIPDIFTHFNNYQEFIKSNIQTTPNTSSNFILNQPPLLYILDNLYPSLFGHVLFIFTLIGIAISFLKIKEKKYFVLILVSTLFALSFIPLQLFATGNRVLVLLPFSAIFSTIVMNRMSKLHLGFLKIIVILLFLIQFIETSSWILIRLQPDPRLLSSEWIVQNIQPKSVIGIENIPIYQMLPDVIVKEFYNGIYHIPTSSLYKYNVISSTENNFPKYVVLSGVVIDNKYIKVSDKKMIVKKLQTMNYIQLIQFKPTRQYNSLFTDEFTFFQSGLMPTLDITIYKKIK